MFENVFVVPRVLSLEIVVEEE